MKERFRTWPRGLRSLLFVCTLLACLLGVSLVTRQGGEAGGALGAARLAWLADGGTIDAVCRPPALRQRFVPDAGHAPQHRQRHARFRALYAALAPQFTASI